jgi:hypothetical protein
VSVDSNPLTEEQARLVENVRAIVEMKRELGAERLLLEVVDLLLMHLAIKKVNEETEP